MSAQYKDLGKVCLTTGGTWSSSQTYEILTLVYDDVNNASYISKKDVPAGTLLSNKSYWQLIVDGSNATIELDNKLDSQSTNPVQNRVITDKFQDLDENINDIKTDIKNIGSCDCVVDSTLSSSSVNPLENKAIYSLLQGIYNRLSVLENSGSTTTHTLSVTLSASPTTVTKGDTTTLSWVGYYDGVVITDALTVTNFYINGEDEQQSIDSTVRSYNHTVNTDENYKITVSYNGLEATSNTVSVTVATESETDEYTINIADEIYISNIDREIVFDIVNENNESYSGDYTWSVSKGGTLIDSNNQDSPVFYINSNDTTTSFSFVAKNSNNETIVEKTINVKVITVTTNEEYTVESGNAVTGTFTVKIGTVETKDYSGYTVTNNGNIIDSGTTTSGSFNIPSSKVEDGGSYTLTVTTNDYIKASTTFTITISEETQYIYYGLASQDPTADDLDSYAKQAVGTDEETHNTTLSANISNIVGELSPDSEYAFAYVIIPKTFRMTSYTQYSLSVTEGFEDPINIDGTEYKFYKSTGQGNVEDFTNIIINIDSQGTTDVVATVTPTITNSITSTIVNTDGSVTVDWEISILNKDVDANDNYNNNLVQYIGVTDNIENMTAVSSYIRSTSIDSSTVGSENTVYTIAVYHGTTATDSKSFNTNN